MPVRLSMTTGVSLSNKLYPNGLVYVLVAGTDSSIIACFTIDLNKISIN